MEDEKMCITRVVLDIDKVESLGASLGVADSVTFSTPCATFVAKVADGRVSGHLTVLNRYAKVGTQFRTVSECDLDEVEIPATGERMAVWVIDSPYSIHVYREMGTSGLMPQVCTGQVCLRFTHRTERLIPHHHTSSCHDACLYGVWVRAESA